MNRILILLTLFCFFSLCSYGQEKNIFKVNLTSLAVKTGSFQYERILTKKISFALSAAYMPGTGLPFSSVISRFFDSDEATDFLKIQSSNMTVTPEIRFYLSKKGNGHGFYIAPFYRYGNLKVSNIDIYYGANSNKIINVDTKTKSSSAGLSLGAQWLVGKRMSIDWVILGPHYGNSKMELIGKTDRAYSTSEQKELLNEFGDNTFITNEPSSVEVDENGLNQKYNDIWGGIRFSLGLGFRF